MSSGFGFSTGQKTLASIMNPFMTSERSPVFNAIRIVVPSPLRCSSAHTAITLRQSFEVADRNARLLAISFSREMLIWRVASIPERKAFSFGISGTSFSVRRRLIVCRICWRVTAPPHIAVSIPTLNYHSRISTLRI